MRIFNFLYSYKRLYAYLLILIIVFSIYRYKEYSTHFNEFEVESTSQSQNYFYDEISEKIGINHKTQNYVPSSDMNNYIGMAPAINYIAVSDFDRDGFVDLAFTTANPNNPLILYKSTEGKSFSDVTESAGLNNTNYPSGIIHAAAFFDYNNDSWPDLYVSRDGCHEIFQNNRNNTFSNISKQLKPGLPCNTRTTGINFADFNSDGYVDVFMTRLYGNNAESGGDTGKIFYIPKANKSNSSYSNQNILLFNNAGNGFIEIDSVAENGILTWAAGISDIDKNGMPDLVTANDFSLNRVFINHKENFKEHTAHFLGTQFQSGNMSVEFGDVFNTNQSDFFVSNISRSSYSVHTYNHLFKKNDSNSFVDIGKSTGTSRCGWAWGSKFIDPNLDSKLDLFVVNGFFDRGPKDYYYKWVVYTGLPAWLTNNTFVLPNTEGHQFASSQRNCLFEQVSSEKFIDVATSVGIGDLLNARGIAVADLQNTGSFDLIIANSNAKPLVYKHHLKENNKFNWGGIHLSGNSKYPNIIGSKLTLRFSGIIKLYEVFPTNGFSAQSDERILFGLGTSEKFDLLVEWPDQKQKLFSNLRANIYTDIKRAENE